MAQTKPSFFRSRIVQVILGLAVALLVIALILPQIISTDLVSGKIKSTINEQIPGIVNFEKLQLSWFKGVHILNFKYLDDVQGVGLTADDISSSKGLLSLATNYKDGGVINISRPKATIVLKETKKATATKAIQQPIEKKTRPSKEKNETKEVQKTSEPFQRPLLPPINVQLNVIDGSLITVGPDQIEKTVIKDIGLHASVDGPAGIIDYQLSLSNSGNTGKVEGAGNIQLPQNAGGSTDGLQSNANIQIIDWQLAEILEMAAARSSAPNGEGVINGTLQLTGRGVSDVALTGEIRGDDIKLHGGALKTDTPSIKTFNLNLNAIAQNKAIELKDLTFTSPFATANLKGNVNDSILQSMTTVAKIDIAAISKQLPATLQIKEGMELSEGVVDINATLNTAGQKTHFATKTFLKRLAGKADGKDISLNQPVDISVTGEKHNDAVTIDDFSIQSSLLTAKGSGDINAMQLTVATDIGNALKEVEKFIDLGTLASDGKLHLTLDIAGDTEDVKDVTGKLMIDGFELQRDGVTISPKDTFAVDFISKLQLREGSALDQIGKSSIEFASWLGKGVLTVDSVTPPTENSSAKIKNGRLETNLDLDRVTTLLHSLKALPVEQNLSGPLDMGVTLVGDNLEQPSVAVVLNAQPFTFRNGDKSFSDESINLTIEAEADLAGKNYSLKNFNLESTPISLSSKGVLASKSNEQELNVTGTSHFNLAALSQQLTSYTDLQLKMTGTSEKPFELLTSTKNGAWQDTPQLTTFDTSFHADTIVGYGLNIESLDLPIQLKDSIGEVDFTATVNRGMMTVKPKVDFSGEYPVASLPDNSTILKEVGLTGDMSNDLLAKVHPLFKGVASTAGTINLDMEHMSWPLGGEHAKDVTFAGSFVFNDVQLQAGTLLTPLLALMKADENSIVLSNTPMTFVGKDEKVTCSALEATVNGYSLILEGSVGFDQSLDYLAKIPITRKMVSSKIYKYLEGTYINVPITGTVSKPTISKSIVQKALSDLVLQAGTKQLSDQAGKLLQNLFK